MEAVTRMPASVQFRALIARLDLDAISIWLLGFVLVVYLGLKGGGYDPLVGDQIGIVVWWIVLAGLLVGAFPRRQPGVWGWVSIGLLAAFVAWTALSLVWTESSGNTSADVARVATYLGIFSLAIFVRGSRGARHMVAAVGTGIAVVSLVALLSRLHPAWFSDATQTASFLKGSRNRLAYPLNYWNALAALIAIGMPLVLNVATTAKSMLWRALGAAVLPAMALTLYLTLSRGGIAAALIALIAYLAIAGHRIPKLATALVAALGGGILIAGAAQRDALHEGLAGPLAHHQGNELLAMVLVVCAGVGLVQAAISLLLVNDPAAWTVPSRRTKLVAVGATAVMLLALAIGLNAPRRVSHAWDQFKSGEAARGGASRLTSAAGENRYQWWKAAIDEVDSKPLTGTGSGTFEFWWTRHSTVPGSVRDTHSLYLQVLGELGVIGLLLLLSFIGVVLGGGGLLISRASRRYRAQLAAALAGCLAFFVTAAFDWVWQVPVLPVATLLLAASLLTAGARSRRRGFAGLGLPAKGALAAASLVAIVAIAVPFSTARLIRESQADARAANLSGALEAARSAQNIEPGSALPHLQQALLLERQSDYAAAAAQARIATEKESVNWRNWLVLSRIEAEAGNTVAAVQAYRRAASLNPRSRIFAG